MPTTHRFLRYFAILGPLLLFVSGGAQAQVFETISNDLKAKVVPYNEREVLQHAYFAKKHRLAAVRDLSAFHKDRLSLQLFDSEEPILLIRQTLREGPNEGTLVWEGHVDLESAAPGHSFLSDEARKRVEARGMTADEFLEQITRVRLFIVYWDVEEVSGMALMSYPATTEMLIGEPTDETRMPRFTRRAFVSIDGEIDLRLLGKGRYRFEPLDNSPKYHVVYEIDPERWFVRMDASSSDTNEDTETARRAARFEEFVASLPAKQQRRTVGDFR